MVRPALRVVPMGWTSAVFLIQATIRPISYEITRIPLHGDVSKDTPIPEGVDHTVLYLDNFDEIRYLHKEIAEEQRGKPSENHSRFISAYEMLGLARNLGKQLSGVLGGTLQGRGLLDRENILRSYEKTVELLELSLGLLSEEIVNEFILRHWTGKAAFAAAMWRPLYSVLQEVYGVMDWARDGVEIILAVSVLDKILCFAALLPLVETDLSSSISPMISCTDTSPSGAGASVATVFKDKSLLIPEPHELIDTCGLCSGDLTEPSWRLYPCPRKCGRRMCSLKCAREHILECNRSWCGMFRPLGTDFRERASLCQQPPASGGLTPRSPLTGISPGMIGISRLRWGSTGPRKDGPFRNSEARGTMMSEIAGSMGHVNSGTLISWQATRTFQSTRL